MSTSLTCTWSTPGQGSAKIELAGNLDYDTADKLADLVNRELTPGSEWSDLHLDCAALDVCDSYGLSILLMIRRIADNVGTRLHLDNRGRSLERLLVLTSTLDHLTGPATTEEAQQRDAGH